MRPHGSGFAWLVLASSVLSSSPSIAQNLLDFWIPNGPVRATLYDPARERLYVGGQFDKVGAPSGAGAIVDPTTGSVLNPLLRVGAEGAIVRAVASDGAGGWFIGGEFTQVEGSPRQNLAQIDAAGNLTAWNPGADGAVHALTLSGGVLYVGGAFGTLGGVARMRLGALDPVSGAAATWAPAANDTVKFLGVFSGVVYAGGDFTNISGTGRNHVAALNSTGVLTTWNPNADGAVRAIYRNGTNVLLGGDFLNVNGTSQQHVALVSATTGVPAPSAVSANGSVYSFEADASRLYVGGFFTTIAGQSRTGIAAFNLSTLAIDTGWNAGLDGAVRDMALLGTQLYIVGDFETVGGGRRAGALRMAASTTTVGAWDPRSGPRTRCVGATATNAFVGGDFVVVNYENSIANFNRNLAAYDFNPSSATFGRPLPIHLDASYAVGPSSIYALAFADPDLYVGGSFGTFNGVARTSASAVRVDTWATEPWAPNPGFAVFSLDASQGPILLSGFTDILMVDAVFGSPMPPPNPPTPAIPSNSLISAKFASGLLFCMGGFDNVGGLPRRRFLITSYPFSSLWQADMFPADSISAGDLTAMEAFELSPNWQSGFVGGIFQHYGACDRGYLLEVDLNTGLPTAWAPNPDFYVRSMAHFGNRYYAGGEFSTFAGLPRARLASWDFSAGNAITSWNPSLWASFGGIFPYSISAASNRIAVGGIFAGANGVYNPNLAVFDDASYTLGVGAPVTREDLHLMVTPNPAHAEATVTFSLAKTASVTIEVLDLQGRVVRRYREATLVAGVHRVPFDSAGLPAGVYLVRLKAGERAVTSRWTRLR